MPGIDSVKIKLQKYQETLSAQMDQMRAEFENKYMDYQSQAATMSDLIKQTKEKELSDLQARIDAFQTKAQQISRPNSRNFFSLSSTRQGEQSRMLQRKTNTPISSMPLRMLSYTARLQTISCRL